MVVGTLNRETKKLHVVFNGNEVICNLVKIPASKDKSVNADGYWASVEKLGASRKWFTIPSLSLAEDVIEFDECKAREVTQKKSRIITLTNIKDFLSEDDSTMLDTLVTTAIAERDRLEEEAIANAPIKEKKSKAMTDEEKLAKFKAEIAKLEAQMRGEIPADEPVVKKAKKTKKSEIADLDEAIDEVDSI